MARDKMYMMVCGCKDVVYEYKHHNVYSGSKCAYCSERFRKSQIIKMEQKMLLKPELKITTEMQQSNKKLTVWPEISISEAKRTYYSYDARTGEISKKKKRIVSKDRHKTLDVFEFMKRNNKG